MGATLLDSFDSYRHRKLNIRVFRKAEQFLPLFTADIDTFNRLSKTCETLKTLVATHMKSVYDQTRSGEHTRQPATVKRASTDTYTPNAKRSRTEPDKATPTSLQQPKATTAQRAATDPYQLYQPKATSADPYQLFQPKAASADPYQPKATSAPRFEVGSSVVLVGLTEHSEFNQHMGTVTHGPRSTDGRLGVTLRQYGKETWVKPENLDPYQLYQPKATSADPYQPKATSANSYQPKAAPAQQAATDPYQLTQAPSYPFAPFPFAIGDRVIVGVRENGVPKELKGTVTGIYPTNTSVRTVTGIYPMNTSARFEITWAQPRVQKGVNILSQKFWAKDMRRDSE